MLEGGGVEAHVVSGPQGAERFALGGELADEIGEVAVVRVAARRPAQDGNRLSGGAVPVGIERFSAWVEEDVAGVVGRHGGLGEKVGEQRASERVGGEDVEALVAGQGRGAGDRVEGPLHVWPDALLELASTSEYCHRLRGAGEVEEVGALGVVELEGPKS